MAGLLPAMASFPFGVLNIYGIIIGLTEREPEIDLAVLPLVCVGDFKKETKKEKVFTFVKYLVYFD